MARILIIGGSGFIGREISRQFLQASNDVSVLNRGSRLVEGATNLTADRDDLVQLRRVLRGQRFDLCIDTTAHRAEQVELLWSVLGTQVPRAIVISSAAVYRDTGTPPLNEDHPQGGSAAWGDYGRNKSAVEVAYRALPHLHHVCIVRPPYVFGEANVADRETWFWTRQLAGAPILLPGVGQTQVQFIHKTDLAAAALVLARREMSGVEEFNVADPHTLSFQALAELLAEVAGLKDRSRYVGRGVGVDARAWFPFHDTPCLTPPGRLMALGWRPEERLAVRFRQTFHAYNQAALRAAYVPTAAERHLIHQLIAGSGSKEDVL